MAPQWILDLGRRCANADGGVHLDPATMDLLTRGIMQSPAPSLDPPPPSESFKWLDSPDPCAPQVEAFVDGSRLLAEAGLYSLCARQGWSFVAYDDKRRLVAAAHGRTPGWATGIHATELWGLLMALQSVDPSCVIKVDCQAVQRGAQRDSAWANAPCRTLARMWGPVAAGLSGENERVVWMPAHNSEADVGNKTLSNGEALAPSDVVGNDLADELAKQIARGDAMPECQMDLVRDQGSQLRDAAMWIGRATAYANNCPLDDLGVARVDGRRRFVRDTDGMQQPHLRLRKRKASALAQEGVSSPRQSAPAEQATAASPCSPGRFPAAGSGASEMHCGRVTKVAKLVQRREAAQNEAQLQRWLESRPPARGVAPVPAAQRMAALRRRVALRAGSS